MITARRRFSALLAAAAAEPFFKWPGHAETMPFPFTTSLPGHPMRESLFPIIVPRSYFQYGNWPGRHRNLKHAELAVTWVELGVGQTMTYLTPPGYEDIKFSGVDPHILAMSNLERASQKLSTHSKLDGDKVAFYAMMHDDGLGSSRLLLLRSFDQLLPQGYWLGIPERSVGIVVPKDGSTKAREEALKVIKECYDTGPSPMLPGLHERDLFEMEI